LQKELHIVAHSMGNFCLKNALDLLNADAAQLAQFRALTRTATFAAPDVSREDFRDMVNYILPQKNSPRDPGAPLVTLFCSRGDLALLASSILRFFGSDFGYRAGLYRAWLVVLSGHRVHPVLLPGQVDTVDASGFATDSFGHGYFSNNGSLLTEISKIINLSKGAQERLLQRPVSLALHNADCTTCANWYRVIEVED
jgi:esterase/lipase superfamily enzyme